MKTMPISETKSAYKPIIYGQQTPIGSGQKEPSITILTNAVKYTGSGHIKLDVHAEHDNPADEKILRLRATVSDT